MMKARPKSTKQNAPLDSKSRKVSEQGLKMPRKSNRKEDPQTRKYLLKTLIVLQQHLKLQPVEKKNTNAKLSANIYQIVKHNVGAIQSHHQYSTQMAVSRDNLAISRDNLAQANRSTASLIAPTNVTASLMHPTTVTAKRRSNSALDQYFKDKFGSPAKDQQGIQKKLRLLKALKRSQQFASKGSGKHQYSTSGLNGVSSCMLQEVSDKNSMIMEKMRNRKK